MKHNFIEVKTHVEMCVFNSRRQYPLDRLIGRYIWALKTSFDYDPHDLEDLVIDITAYLLSPRKLVEGIRMDDFDEKKGSKQQFINYCVLSYVSGKVKGLYLHEKHKKIETKEVDFGGNGSFLSSIIDDELSPEKTMMQKQALEKAEEILGEGLLDVALGNKTQADLAREEGVSSSGISQRYKKRLKELEKSLNKVYSDPA